MDRESKHIPDVERVLLPRPPDLDIPALSVPSSIVYGLNVAQWLRGTGTLLPDQVSCNTMIAESRCDNQAQLQLAEFG